METAVQWLLERVEDVDLTPEMWEQIKLTALEKEKEQIKKAFADGQETPLNHPITPMYSNEEYYNDNYNQK